MKAFLLFQGRDFDFGQTLPWSEKTLVPDLAVDTLFSAMAGGDEFLLRVAESVVLCSLDNDLDTVLYRQRILQDCLKNPAVVRGLYALAVEGIQCERKSSWGIFSKYPAGILGRAIELLHYLIEVLQKLRSASEQYGAAFQSEGFGNLFATLEAELTDEYFASIKAHLKEVKFRAGVMISAQLGKGNKGRNYILRRARIKQHWIISRLQQYFGIREPGYTFALDPRDENAESLIRAERAGDQAGSERTWAINRSYPQFFQDVESRTGILCWLPEFAGTTGEKGGADLLAGASSCNRTKAFFSRAVRCLFIVAFATEDDRK